MQAFVFNIQKYSLHDGDGIRTTVFFKGCPLTCTWCHNPEGQSPNPQIVFYPEKCRNCGHCVRACPKKVCQKKDSPPMDDSCIDSSCIDVCGACADACVYGAKEIAGKAYSPEELIRIVERDEAFYQVSGGGVTLSGGEVMMQNRDFLLQLAKGLKQKGLHLAIDTCGHAPADAYEDILPYADIFLYDIKLIDNERHLYFTGQDNSLILSNLKMLSDKGAKLNIRIPVIEGVNAHDTEINAIIQYLKENIQAERISLLPYHTMGKDKYQRIGMNGEEGEENNFSTPSTQRMEELAERFRQHGFPNVQIGG